MGLVPEGPGLVSMGGTWGPGLVSSMWAWYRRAVSRRFICAACVANPDPNPNPSHTPKPKRSRNRNLPEGPGLVSMG